MLRRARGAALPRPPAKADVIVRLQAESKLDLPWAYLRLLQESDGGEWALPHAPGAFVLWPAEEVVALNQRFEVDESYPGLFGFGSDGAATLFAFDTRPGPPWPVVTAPFVGHPLEIVALAPDFESFRARLGR